MEEDPGDRVGQRQDEGPEDAENGLAVLGADVAHGQPPGELAAGEEVAVHVPQHLPRAGEG